VTVEIASAMPGNGEIAGGKGGDVEIRSSGGLGAISKTDEV